MDKKLTTTTTTKKRRAISLVKRKENMKMYEFFSNWLNYLLSITKTKYRYIPCPFITILTALLLKIQLILICSLTLHLGEETHYYCNIHNKE